MLSPGGVPGVDAKVCGEFSISWLLMVAAIGPILASAQLMPTTLDIDGD
jgi:hypothetical protein